MMTRTDRIRAFVDTVAGHFEDLSEPDRIDLLDDLEQHLSELATDDPDGFDHALSDPAHYASELRASAGLPGPRGGSPGRRMRAQLMAWRDRLRDHPWTAEVRAFLPQLRPAWWVVRGWVLAIAAWQFLLGGPWWGNVPIPGRNPLGLLAVVIAVIASVRLGRDGRDRRRSLRLVDAVARVAAVVLLVQAATTGGSIDYVSYVDADVPDPSPVLRHADGEPITNLYLFDGDGNPVTNVFVYDGMGRPVEIGDLAAIGFDDIDTVYDRAPDGTPLTNRYPLEQYVLDYEAEHDDAERGTRWPERTHRAVPDVELPGAESPTPTAPDDPTGTSSPAPRS